MMICSNCFEADYVTVRKNVTYNFNNMDIVLDSVECQTCPVCNEVIYSQAQFLELEKKRIMAEFKLVPNFGSFDLKLLRKILNASLDEISDLLQIGKNTYGRWERGDIDITPSMKLLVYHLIEKIPEAKVNLLDIYMNKEILDNKRNALTKDVSLGQFIENICSSTKLLYETVSNKIQTDVAYLNKILKNEIIPEDIPVNITGNIVSFFKLTVEDIVSMLNNSLKIISLRDDVSFMHARKSDNSSESVSAQSKTVNKILEMLKDDFVDDSRTVSEDYIKQVIAYLDQKEMREVRHNGN